MPNNYIQVTISNISEEQSSILIAQLAEIGFEGFEEADQTLKAYTDEQVFDAAALEELMQANNVTCITNTVAHTNWNEEWEKNFEPVIVDDFVAIRADFHAPAAGVEREIVITPKMSFGTGHHATTFLMMQQMRAIDFAGKSVFDFGTGTGILAILAAQLGAGSVLAIDNDEWSIENAQENVMRNNCSNITLLLNDNPAGEEKFDIILANINKNVILTYISVLAERLNTNGQLLLSGLLKEDEEDVKQAANNLQIKYICTTHKNNWVCLVFFS
ncbi:50S ribosomal protein L11 methyltransferase [Panacibacter sp. DH6]|uniref:Ribosomal protein L11 methyltransferase n=1 Tax=Panacibacter microcysteis TaxID=2793269 RepID=A0A931E523_9BACT|nr:50S ribosomal protein L11 methyltransferase [Panacibacter microcysteis]MBG9375289.1 50S ribosomal protein L11 methyltransferase [Panacibacter microcysteis]